MDDPAVTTAGAPAVERAGTASSVRAAHAARPDAAQPRRRVADADVLGARRHRRRLASRAPRALRARRRGPRDRRGDGRVSRGPQHAARQRTVERRAGRRVRADHRVPARQRRGVRDPAAARRAQGVVAGAVGRLRADRPSATRRAARRRGSRGGRRARAGATRTRPRDPIGEAEVGYLLERYTHAARLALRAGFDAIEIHAAHGYLLHSFLSPLSNTRGDAYGGDRDGRMRLPLQVVAAVRAVWPAERPLFFRMSTVDGVGIGWSLDDSVELARRLRALGVDVVDCSSGGMNLPSAASLVAREPGFQVPFAREVRRAVRHRDDGGRPDPHAGARQRGDRRRRRGPGRAGPRASVESELGGAGRGAARRRSGLANVAPAVRLVAAPARPAPPRAPA